MNKSETSSARRDIHRAALLAGALMLLNLPAAQAVPITWHLEGVTFDDGGVASGSFVFDADKNKVTTWNISVSGGDEGQFPPFSFTRMTAPDRAVFDASPGYSAQFWVDSSAPGGVQDPAARSLSLTTDAPLTNAADSVALTSITGFASNECYNCSPARSIVSGNLNADPYVACGTTLTSNTTLVDDMSCDDTALYLSGSASTKVTLDCAGFSVETLQGSAIVASNARGVTIRNCYISTSADLSHGILLSDGTRESTVSGNTILTSGRGAQGIELQSAFENRITDNWVSTGGGDAGAMRMLRGSDTNLVRDNSLTSQGGYALRIESSSANKVYDNTLAGAAGYVLQRSYSLQDGGLGIDTSGNIYAVENNLGSSSGLGTVTAFFQVNPADGLGHTAVPLLEDGNDVGYGFDALAVLPNGRVMALGGAGPTSILVEINPLTGEVVRQSGLNLLIKLNGLQAMSNTSLLTTTNTGALFKIDLNTNNLTTLGLASKRWTDIAVQPGTGATFAVSRSEDEASSTAHLYQIDSADGEILAEIGDTGLPVISGIDFAAGVLYGNAGGRLVIIASDDAQVFDIGRGFGADPLEPLPRNNRLRNNRMESVDGSLTFTDSITLPSVFDADLSNERVDIGVNRVLVDSANLPFLDEPARIELYNLGGLYRKLQVDASDDDSFEPCVYPQCELVEFDNGDLVFDVGGFTTYRSVSTLDPGIQVVVDTVRAETGALKGQPGLSKGKKKKLKSAGKKLGKASKYLRVNRLNKGFTEIRKAITDLQKVPDATSALIEQLVNAVSSETRDAIDAALAQGADPALVDAAIANMAKADDMLKQDKSDRAIKFFLAAWTKAQKAIDGGAIGPASLAGNWTWVSGSDVANLPGVYGTQGVADPTNVPGARSAAVTWSDAGGNLWLFGGTGVDSNDDTGNLNDLWKFDGNDWTWISGSDVVDQPGVYGTQGVADPANVPGARSAAVSWSDAGGNLWLSGGAYLDVNGSGGTAYLNDLWKFDGSHWIWISGANIADQPGVYGTQGVADPANVPGARREAVSWSDPTGNLWLFAGFGADSVGCCDQMNDLWKFDGDHWTWVAGSDVADQSGVYGTQGVAGPANVPGARFSAVSWSDTSGNLWLFGGDGKAKTGYAGSLNDLWKFDGNHWTWVSGSDTGPQTGVYGTQGVADPANVPGSRTNAVSWTDAEGNLWLLGGQGWGDGCCGDLSDLWKFDGEDWAWISGSQLPDEADDVFGAKGVAAVTNVLGAKSDAVSWVDAAGRLWLFGGYDRLAGVSQNSLWRYDPLWFEDADGDGFGDQATGTGPLPPDATWVADFSDCDDAEPTAFPGAIETNDEVDNDCDGDVDEDFRKYVFVTSQTYIGGNIGGLAAADALCQGLADSPGAVLPAGEYKAWLSSSTENAKERITDDPANLYLYVIADDTRIARGLADLIDGELDVAIKYDETGALPGIPNEVLTGTSSGGVHTGNSCGDWSDTFQGATRGFKNSETLWTSYTNTGSCQANAARLYCFQK